MISDRLHLNKLYSASLEEFKFKIWFHSVEWFWRRSRSKLCLFIVMAAILDGCFDKILTNLKGANGEMLDVKYHPIWSSRLREEVNYVQS